MRYCSSSAVRSLTFFTLVVLSSHSFVSVNAQSSTSDATNSLTSPTVSPPSSSPTPSLPSSASSPAQSSSPPSSVLSVPSTNSSPSAAAPAQSSSSSVPPSSTSKSSSAVDTSSSSTTVSSATSLASQASSTLSVPPATGPAYPIGSYSSYSYNGALPTPSTSSADPGQTAVAATSDKGFSSNKGAVTAVAVIAAIVGVGILGFIVFKVLKRRARLRDEEDEVYFEKYHEQEPPLNTSGPSDSSYNIAAATRPAAQGAYPDRAYHYGSQPAAGTDAYNNPQQYGMEYPPGTAYGAAAHGGQYQYNNDVGGYGAAAPGNHPYAYQQNNYRTAAGPPAGQPTYDQQADTGFAQ